MNPKKIPTPELWHNDLTTILYYHCNKTKEVMLDEFNENPDYKFAVMLWQK